MQEIIAIRGAGDLATGVIQKFYRAGMNVIALETAHPTAVRRKVALCEAVYDGGAVVEDMRARLIERWDDCGSAWSKGEIPVLVDPKCECVPKLSPNCLIDAILAKRNLGTRPDMAPIVIALGPGFCAPQDAHAVIETMRGHELGRVLFAGLAQPNTGVPGIIGGKGAERVLRAPCDGMVSQIARIGACVKQGEDLFAVGGCIVRAPFDGLLRGLIRDGLLVPKGAKCADIDPRLDVDMDLISDKARSIGGGALEAYLCLRKKNAASFRAVKSL